MRLLGAELALVASVGGDITKKLTRGMIKTARRIAEESGIYWTNQLNNTNQIVCYVELGEGILEQAGSRVDAFL